MIFNKLIRIDLIFILAIAGLFIIPGGRIYNVVPGIATMAFIIFILNHFRHFRTYKKFY